MKRTLALLLLSFVTLPVIVRAEAVRETIQSSTGSKSIEYFWSKPEGHGPFPMLLMIHPDQDSPKNGGKSFVESGQLEYWEIGWLTEAKLHERSVLYLAHQIKSPVLIIHGTQDDRAPIALAEEFSNAIRSAGGNAELVRIESEHVIPMTKIEGLMASFMIAH